MGSNPTLSVGMVLNGEVLEWPNRRDWKSRVPSQGEPWVRIPPSPPILGRSCQYKKETLYWRRLVVMRFNISVQESKSN